MRDTLSFVGACVLGVVAVVGLIYGGLYLYSDYGPRKEAIERNIYENTPSYVQGKITTISRLKFEFQTTNDPQAKQALKELIIREASTVDRSKLPTDLRSFVVELERGDGVVVPQK